MARPRKISDEQIDAAARATFIELGPGASVAMVAKKLGVSHTALFQRAGSKDRLMARALGPGVPQVVQRLAEPPPKRRKATRLASLLEELLSVHEQVLPGLLVLRARGRPVTPPEGLEAPTLMLRRLLAGWLARASSMPPRRADALAELLLGALEARCFNAYLGGPSAVAPSSPRKFVRDLVAPFARALSPGKGVKP